MRRAGETLGNPLFLCQGHLPEEPVYTQCHTSHVCRGAEDAHCSMAELWPHTLLPDPRRRPRGGLPVGLKQGARFSTW